METSRNKMLVLAVAAVLALAFAVPAFATVGDSGYISWTGVGSPHGGYTTTTQKCAVCHAVHNADATFGSELLLQGSVADACEYCHVGGAGGYTQVYGGNPNNYYGTDYDTAHNLWMDGPTTVGVRCTTCHQVHAAADAMTSNAYLTSKLLVGDKTFSGTNYAALAQAPLSTDTSNTALTKWCGACHPAGLGTPYAYYNGADWSAGAPDYSGTPNITTSHVMTDDIASYTFPDGSTGQVAWAGSNECSSCHTSGYGTAAWPHFTPGAVRFLTAASGSGAAAAGATDSKDDGVCLRCHRNGTGTTSGVGLGW